MAIAVATFTTVVVFPTPPFWFATTYRMQGTRPIPPDDSGRTHDTGCTVSTAWASLGDRDRLSPFGEKEDALTVLADDQVLHRQQGLIQPRPELHVTRPAYLVPDLGQGRPAPILGDALVHLEECPGEPLGKGVPLSPKPMDLRLQVALLLLDLRDLAVQVLELGLGRLFQGLPGLKGLVFLFHPLEELVLHLPDPVTDVLDLQERLGVLPIALGLPSGTLEVLDLLFQFGDLELLLLPLLAGRPPCLVGRLQVLLDLLTEGLKPLEALGINLKTLNVLGELTVQEMKLDQPLKLFGRRHPSPSFRYRPVG
jgi:hypothetical protein